MLGGLLAACTAQPDPAARAAPTTVRTEPVPASPAAPQLAPASPAAAPVAAAAEPAAETDTADQYETMYVVIADTSRQYRPLRRQMLRLQAVTSQRIDTMGRFYDPKKNLIRLPDNDADEVYAGDYFPRRTPDATLSVEYTTLYTSAHDKSMALVTGIYQEPARADSLLAVVRRTVPTAFRVKTRMFMGCLH
ncbi:hypothetical protein DLM85_05580 [Hymenobacter edaphi]|uniref:Uncharacterized protein n=2 Tax=Hymenobacter edaphi TaxID=2211146 RepID=A0A328BUG2_9BACT|nr:hypothetical protein DLM85_05580 [Hymenobacter edaphi]